jgi:hypothetical protein
MVRADSIGLMCGWYAAFAWVMLKSCAGVMGGYGPRVCSEEPDGIGAAGAQHMEKTDSTLLRDEAPRRIDLDRGLRLREL